MSEQATESSVEVKASTIEFGSLREKVKHGDLEPNAVLTWYQEQEFQYSKSFVTFLKNQRRPKKKRAEETKEEPESDDRQETQKGKPRRRKRKKPATDEQS